MSERIFVEASANDPFEALRTALERLASQLGASGRGPGQIARLVIASADPAALDPSRHEADLVLREAYGAFAPPAEAQLAEIAGVRLEAELRPAPAPSAEPPPIVDGLPLPELARQYSPRTSCDIGATFRLWAQEGPAFRAGWPRAGLDLAYGPGRLETLDLYLPQHMGARPAPLFVFIHGGYWQAVDKAQQAQFAAGLLAQGRAVAMLNYPLAPAADLDVMSASCLKATAFLLDRARGFGLDPERIVISGHSAGGHLGAMTLEDAQVGPRLAGALLVSGVFDLAPVRRLGFGPAVGLRDEATALRQSPASRSAPAAVASGATRVVLAVGGGESDAFKSQSARLARAWGLAEPLHVGATNHFTVLETLKAGALLDAALDLTA